jgi:hypothetical protein
MGVSTFSEVGRTLSELTDIDLQGVTDGSILVYNTNKFVARTLSGDATLSASGVLTISPNSVALGVDTTGNYVSTIAGTTDQVIVSGSGGESATITLSLPQSVGLTSSPTFNNITLNGSIINVDLTDKLDSKAPKHNPTFTGTVNGISATMVGLGNVNNTSDAGKPVSDATLTALDGKVDKVTGKVLSDTNYTSAEKTKLAGIATGAEINVSPDWNATSGSSRILNKPTTLAGYGITDATAASHFAGHVGDASIHLTQAQSSLINSITVSSAAINYLSGVTSNIQSQLNSKQGSDVDLTSIAALEGTGVLRKNGVNNWVLDTTNYSADGHSHAVATTATSGFLANYDKVKLDGVATGATANSTDAHLLNRANHTGTQSHSTITGLGTLATQSGTFSGFSSGTNTGDQTITLLGDASGSGKTGITVTLANTGVGAGIYGGDATTQQSLTIDAKGRITAVGQPVTISPNFLSITNRPSTLSGYFINDGVDLYTTQTITGSKTFTVSPYVPLTPTFSNQATSKNYVDNAVRSLSITELTTARTLSTADVNQYIRCASITGTTITVPPNNVVGWPDGATIYFRRVSGAGPILIVGGANVTINGAFLAPSILENQSFALKRLSSDVWDFV